jgi:CBS domain-containing protein
MCARQALAGLCVGDLMEPHPLVAHADETLTEFMDEVAGSPRYTAYPVMRRGTPVGLLPLAGVVAISSDDWACRRVGESMIPRADTPVFAEDEPVLAALDTLAESRIGRGLVVDGERLAGLLSMTNISRQLAAARPK